MGTQEDHISRTTQAKKSAEILSQKQTGGVTVIPTSWTVGESQSEAGLDKKSKTLPEKY
jgi:hypothetical protein